MNNFSIPQSKIKLWSETELVGLTVKIIFPRNLKDGAVRNYEDKVLVKGVLTGIKYIRDYVDVSVLNSLGDIESWEFDYNGLPWRVIEITDEL